MSLASPTEHANVLSDMRGLTSNSYFRIPKDWYIHSTLPDSVLTSSQILKFKFNQHLGTNISQTKKAPIEWYRKL
ncbi:hypothetical protein RJT34_30646 [Clitoria ternatea]|uniref:Uncharacterized protein n=1 Tax=Clitoria ternatea TaxID=43366 RepID=A0AAN9I265_CLITE